MPHPDDRRMTVADLIDYLKQFEPDTPVVRSIDDIESPGEFIALDCIDMSYTVEDGS